MLVSHFEANFQSIGVRLPSYMHIYKTSVLRHREIPLQRKTERVLYVINSSIELSWEEKNTVYIGDFVLFISTQEMVLIKLSLPEESRVHGPLQNQTEERVVHTWILKLWKICSTCLVFCLFSFQKHDVWHVVAWHAKIN